MVRHSTLTSKHSIFDITESLYNWLIRFLDDSDHTTNFGRLLFMAVSINASVIQGSGLGPFFYTVDSPDLKLKYASIIMDTYADDIYLLVGYTRRATLGDELRPVCFGMGNRKQSYVQSNQVYGDAGQEARMGRGTTVAG